MASPSTRVVVPARADYVRVLRAMTADAAGAADLSFNTYADLELAVGEASSLLLSSSPAQLRCGFVVSAGRVETTLEAVAPESTASLDGLATLVLRSVADDVTFEPSEPTPTVRIVVAEL